MSIYIRCNDCKRYASIKNQECPNCSLSFKKGTKSYYVYYRANNKQIYEYAGTSLPIAREIDVKRKTALRLGGIEEYIQVKDYSFTSFMHELFIPHYETKNKAADKEKSKFKILCEYFGHKSLKEFTLPDIEKFYKFRMKTCAPATCKNNLSILRRIFNYAIELGYIKTNPVRMMGVKFDNKRMRYLTAGEKERLLEECQKSQQRMLYPIVMTALCTGMRKGEIALLKSPDIIDGIIYIKGDNAKNSTGRQIPVIEKLQKIFDIIGDFDFSMDTKKSFNRAVKNAGIVNFRFHDLRHSFASDLVQSGVDLYTVSKLLGHTTTEMTQRYAHLSPKSLLNAIQNLDDK